MRFVIGKEYRVLKEGAHLSWERPIGPSCWRGESRDLHAGDVLTYTGSKNGWGSDSIPLDNFSLGDVKGEFWPNNWGMIETGWMEPVDSGEEVPGVAKDK